MSAAAKPRRSWLSLFIPTLVAFAILIGLGTWQLQRKAWKEALIASLTAELAAAPVALPAPAMWASLDPSNSDYHRVTFSAEFDHSKEALVFAAPSAFRPDVTGLGYWVFTPARLSDGGMLFVNRGFVPEGRQDPKSRPEGQISGPVNIVGVMRWPDSRHWFTPSDEPAKNLWFSRDPLTIAAAKDLAKALGPVAPFYVEQESPVPPSGFPQPGKLLVRLPDNHLHYALTWYGLALVLVVVFATWAFHNGRSNSGSGVASPPPEGASPFL